MGSTKLMQQFAIVAATLFFALQAAPSHAYNLNPKILHNSVVAVEKAIGIAKGVETAIVSIVAKPELVAAEKNAIKDCINKTETAIDSLKWALQAVKEINKNNVETKIGNAFVGMTYALDNERRCIDELRTAILPKNMAFMHFLVDTVEKVVRSCADAVHLIDKIIVD